MVVEKRGLSLTCSTGETTFSKAGFTNWKKALEKFDKHQSTSSHRESVELLVTIPSNTKDVGEMLSKAHAEQKAENRRMLKMILSSIRYLGRQGLALRGHYKIDESGRRGEFDSNLIQLLRTRAEDEPTFLNWLEKSQDKFTSPDIQNEILLIMAMHILRQIASELSGKWYTVMVDETTDLSNTEQMVLCLRHVDDNLEVHEELIGLYSLDATTADVLVATIQDVLLRMNLSINNCRGQCYDGCSSMSGSRSGVATRLSALEPRALYTHCYGHALNLAIQDVIKGVKIMGDTLDTVYEITKLIKKSPKRDTIFQKIKNEVGSGSPGVRILCPTRWTVRAEALASISENYQALQLTWDTAKEAARDTETRARIGGVAAQMEKFDFFFGIELGRKVLNMADNLSRSLQAATLSACGGQQLVKTTLATFQAIRTDECFSLFWEYLEVRRSSGDISPPTLPRARKVPRRYEVGVSTPVHPNTTQDHYKAIYFQVIDLAMAAITDRFNQRGFQMLQTLETLLTAEQPQRADLIKEVASFYVADLSNPDRLQVQLNALHTQTAGSDLDTIVAYLTSLGGIEKEYYSEVFKLVKLILVMPATNAVSERSFSALRRVKTWLRTTSQQVRLNWCMILHVHKDRTDALPLCTLANEFIDRNESRLRIFGHF